MRTLLRPPVTLAEAWSDPVLALGLGLGSGCARRAPGTAGTVLAVPLCWLAQYALSPWGFAALTAVLCLVGVGICGRSARLLGVHDHPAIVWDEIAGLFITLVGAPQGWPWLVAGFALFRLFDILKPWPISLADRRLSGGFGIMADDILAGLAACACLQALTGVTG